MKGLPPHKLKRSADYQVFSKSDYTSYMINQCLREMYAMAQPPADYDEILELARNGHEDDQYPFFEQHYLSKEETQLVLDKYLDMTNLEPTWKDDCDTMIEYLSDGGYHNVIKHDNLGGSYRDAEKLAPIQEYIGEEAFAKVLEYMNECKSYYRYGSIEKSAFVWPIINVAPTSNKERVIEFWKSQGVDIEIIDRTEDDIYAIHYEGVLPEDLDEYYEDINECNLIDEDDNI